MGHILDSLEVKVGSIYQVTNMLLLNKKKKSNKHALNSKNFLFKSLTFYFSKIFLVGWVPDHFL